jgi:hypothetical protein
MDQEKLGRWNSPRYQGCGHQQLEGHGYEKGGMQDFCGRPRPTLGCRASDDDDVICESIHSDHQANAEPFSAIT